MQLNLKRSLPMQQQIADQLREKILTHELTIGMRLPTAGEMAKEWNTNPFTVHAALTTLVKEGLIERHRRRGSFVRSNKLAATKVIGIYCCEAFWLQPHMGFIRALQETLRCKWGELGYQVRLMVDHRARDLQQAVPEYLREAIEEKTIHGLCVLLACASDGEWIGKLTIPASVLSTVDLPNRVGSDFHQFFELALDRLQAQGCKSVGLITHINVHSDSAIHRPDHPYLRFYDEYAALCRARGMEVRNSWIRSPLQDVDNHALFGYSEFLKLWQQPQRPEGLIVYPDAVAVGVAKALYEMDDVRPKLVLHRNRGVSLSFPPISASWISTDIDLVADALIRQTLQQIEGQAVTPIEIPHSISPQEEVPSQSGQ